MDYRGNAFSLTLPNGWRDETVHRFFSPDREETIRVRLENTPSDAPLEQRLLEKTSTVREGLPSARLVSEEDAMIGPEPAKAFRIDGERGDEVPLTYLGMLARWGDRQLLVIEYEGPTAQFGEAIVRMRAIASSMRRREDAR